MRWQWDENCCKKCVMTRNKVTNIKSGTTIENGIRETMKTMDCGEMKHAQRRYGRKDAFQICESILSRFNNRAAFPLCKEIESRWKK